MKALSVVNHIDAKPFYYYELHMLVLTTAS
jgi:hypothetical protein